MSQKVTLNFFSFIESGQQLTFLQTLVGDLLSLYFFPFQQESRTHEKYLHKVQRQDLVEAIFRWHVKLNGVFNYKIQGRVKLIPSFIEHLLRQNDQAKVFFSILGDTLSLTLYGWGLTKYDPQLIPMNQISFNTHPPSPKDDL